MGAVLNDKDKEYIKEQLLMNIINEYGDINLKELNLINLKVSINKNHS